MRARRGSFRVAVALVVLVSFVYLLARSRPAGQQPIEPLLFASRLVQPRGLGFTADGTLLVAEAGRAGGAESAPGRISALGPTGRQVTLVDGLPAAAPEQPLFAQSGPTYIVPISGTAGAATPASAPAGTLYTAYVGLGPAAGAPLGALAALTQTGTGWQLSTLGTFGGALPAAAGSAAMWTATLAADGALHALVPLGNALVEVPNTGETGGPPAAQITVQTVTGFLDAGQKNPLPAGLAAAPGGAFYVTFFGPEPYRARGGRVVRVETDGRWQVVADGLTFPIAATLAGGRLLVLELAASYNQSTGRFAPNSGRLLSMDPAGGPRRVVVHEVNYPTALITSPGGDVYFTESGVFAGSGEGRVLRILAPVLGRYR